MKPNFNLAKLGLMSLFAAVLFTSCKKDTPENNPSKPGATKLKKVSSDDEVMEFGYGADGSLQSVKTSSGLSGAPATFTVRYAADKSISELSSSDGSRIVPHYSNGELTTADLFEGNDQLAVVRYEYLNGSLKSTVMEMQGVEALKFMYNYDAAGNVSRMTSWGFNPMSGQLEATGRTDYQYDGKTNPMTAHKNLLYLLLQNTPKNNVTKETTYDEQDQVSETVEYAYTYNSQSLPQSATVKTTPAGSAAVTSTLTFLYQ